MYKFNTILFAFLALLAGRVYALNITLNIGNQVNFTANQFLTVDDTTLQTNSCADDKCLCSSPVVQQITKCEQCYFEQLIKDNRPMPNGDIRAGGQSALAAYSTACANQPNITVSTADTALKIPSDIKWDGPFEQLLNTGTTAIVLVAALTIGCGAIGVLIFM
ncbi:hypothetical protein BDW22DRAFT_39542 [Trametopsis cervina]|nr:hypothetical protein BDW22DRAFT_39542 [Trametopsis cervina]